MNIEIIVILITLGIAINSIIACIGSFKEVKFENVCFVPKMRIIVKWFLLWPFLLYLKLLQFFIKLYIERKENE